MIRLLKRIRKYMDDYSSSLQDEMFIGFRPKSTKDKSEFKTPKGGSVQQER